MRRLLLLTPILLAGCYTPPGEHKFENSATINQPQPQVWQKTVDYFAYNNIPIKTIDKNSNIISGEKQGDSKLADCGMERGDAIADVSEEKPNISFNVLLNASKSSTIATVNTTISQAKAFKPMEGDVPVPCKSTGELEKQILSYLKGEAPAKPKEEAK